MQALVSLVEAREAVPVSEFAELATLSAAAVPFPLAAAAREQAPVAVAAEPV